MARAAVIRHLAFEDLGLLEPLLRQRGYDCQTLEAGVDDLSAAADADLLVVLGGPIGVYEQDVYPFLRTELDLLQRRLTAQRPTIGICLGAQLMACALGKRVYPSGVKEIGWGPLTITDAGLHSPLAPLADGTAVLHWHGDTFDLPDGAGLLASTDLVKHQAFSLGNFGLGLQFHLEADPAKLERWYIGHACEISATAGVDVPLLRRQAAEHAAKLVPAAEAVFRNWLDGVV